MIYFFAKKIHPKAVRSATPLNRCSGRPA